MSHDRILTFEQADQATVQLREALAMISCVAHRDPETMPQPVSADETMLDTTMVACFASTRVRWVLEMLDEVHERASAGHGQQQAAEAQGPVPRTREQVEASLASARGFVEHLEAELASMDADQ